MPVHRNKFRAIFKRYGEFSLTFGRAAVGGIRIIDCHTFTRVDPSFTSGTARTMSAEVIVGYIFVLIVIKSQSYSLIRYLQPADICILLLTVVYLLIS